MQQVVSYKNYYNDLKGYLRRIMLLTVTTVSGNLVERFYVVGAPVGRESTPPAADPSSLIINAGLGSNLLPVFSPNNQNKRTKTHI